MYVNFKMSTFTQASESDGSVAIYPGNWHKRNRRETAVQNYPLGVVSSLKLATELAWTLLFLYCATYPMEIS